MTSFYYSIKIGLIFDCAEPTKMKKYHYNLFQIASGHAHNLILSIENLCDRFLAFLCPSTFKRKKEALCKI